MHLNEKPPNEFIVVIAVAAATDAAAVFLFNVYVKPVEINRFIESVLIPIAAACVKCARGYWRWLRSSWA